MNFENLITIKGGAYTDVKKALQQWINLYSGQLEEDITFQIYKNGKGNHVIKADDRLDNEHFYFLVNYLKYPEDIEYKIAIEGFTTEKTNTQLLDKKILVYISEDDVDFDNVFVVTSDNFHYKIDFGGKVTPIKDSKIFITPEISNIEVPEILKSSIERIKIESESAIEKRFKITSIIFFVALLSYYAIQFLFSLSIQSFEMATFMFGLGISGWFMQDYKLLQIPKIYLSCFIIATLFFATTYLVNQTLSYPINLTEFGATFPLSTLIVQKPLRFIFLSIFKREPIIDKPIPTFWDGVYLALLIISILILNSLLKSIF